MKQRIYVYAVLALAGMTGCNTGASTPSAVGSASLHELTTCEDVRQGYEADAIEKINTLADDMIRYQSRGWGGLGGGPQEDANNGAPRAATAATGPQAISQTNTQVQGVDEADIVKFDGQRLFVLGHDGQGSALRMLRSWPANESRLVASTTIEGYASEMFLAGDRLAVFSNVQDPRVDRANCHDPDGTRPLPSECYSGSGFTKVTLLRANGDAFEVERETYLQGYYNTSRRYGNVVQLILQAYGWFYDWRLPEPWTFVSPGNDDPNGPDYEDVRYESGDGTYRRLRHDVFVARVEAYRAAAIAAARAKTVADWLPARVDRVNGQLVTAAPDCSSHFLPQPGLVDYGTTELVTLDLDNSSRFSVREISGYTTTVYSNANTLVLVQPDWSVYYRTRADSTAEVVESRSLLHAFNLGESGAVAYEGSAFFGGAVNNQFQLDEANGSIRVAATVDRFPVYREGQPVTTRQWQALNFVTTFAHGRSGVAQQGQLEIQTDNERIQSARFVGDTAYVVTFRQTDPLFAIDLHDAAQPRLLGALHIPGFSTYMHPLDASHLLTIGYDADAQGRTTGMQLQIFDVSNPVVPQLAHRQAITPNGDYAYSEANWNHKAFTFFPERGLLAFPVAAWGTDGDYYRYESSLEVYRVSAATGFAAIASLHHDDFVGPYCLSQNADRWYCEYNDVAVQRGVFADDYVYSISEGGVKVHDTRDPRAAVASVPFARRIGLRP